MHALQIEARQTGHARAGIEVVFHMALSAGQIRRRDLFKVRSQRVDHIGVGHRDLAGFIGMAGIAADPFAHKFAHVVEGVLINLRSDLIHEIREVRRLAGPALGHCMRAAGFQDVVHVIEMSPGTAVELGKTIGFIQCDKLGVFLQVIRNLVVFLVLHKTGVDFGIVLLPVSGMQDRNARHRLYLFGDTLSGMLGFRNGEHRSGRRPVRRFRTTVELTADQPRRNDSETAYDAEDIVQDLIFCFFHDRSFCLST